MLSAVSCNCGGAVSLEKEIEKTPGIHVPHNTIHLMLKDADVA